jgi:tetratricopeptide (TPR) repeat protein
MRFSLSPALPGIAASFLFLASPGGALLAAVPAGQQLASDASAALAEARSAIDSYGGQPEPLLRAEAILDRILTENPRDHRAWRERGRLIQVSGLAGGQAREYQGHSYDIGVYRTGTLEAAEAAIRESIRIKPDFAQGYVLLGHVLTEQERKDEAADALRQAEALGTDDPWLDLNWAALHESRAEPAAAAARWRKVLDGPTTDPRARGAATDRLADHYGRQGKHDIAVAIYRAQIDRSVPGQRAWRHSNLAGYLSGIGRYDEAIAHARQALAIMDFGAARHVLAHALFERWAELVAAGRVQEASALFEEAAGLKPDLEALMIGIAPKPERRGLARTLVEQGKVSVNARARDGSTPLLIAVNNNDAATVKFLLELGADPNVGDVKGWTPLISAADEGNAENVRMLLAAGARRTDLRRDKTAELHAQAKGFGEVARMIREYTAPN